MEPTTEAEWLASFDGLGLYQQSSDASSRKRALIITACLRLPGRPMWHAARDPGLTPEDLEWAADARWEEVTARGLHPHQFGMGSMNRYEPDCVAAHFSLLDPIDGRTTRAKLDHVCRSEDAARVVREVVGNPFRPVAFDPAWRTDTAVSLAKGMYDSRDFSVMPILADALQDAGCDNDDVLNHCRDPQQVHVRGCWVVDLMLGKR